jgi:hypothetical protein
MTYQAVMELQWRMLEADRPDEVLTDPAISDDVRSVVADGMTYGWRMDRIRREVRLVGVLRRIFPATTVAFASSSDDAVRRFLGSPWFRRRAREVGSTYPPLQATARAFVEYVRGGGWTPGQWWLDCLRYESGLAIPSEATFPGRQALPGGWIADDAWVVGAEHDYETYAEKLGRGIVEKPWRLAALAQHPQRKTILVFSLVDGDRVRRVKLSGPVATAVWTTLDPEQAGASGASGASGDGSPGPAAADPLPALERLVEAGFLRRSGS